MNKKLTGIILDLFALCIWAFSSFMLFHKEIPFIWDGIAYYAAGLVVFTADESTINTAVRKLLGGLVNKVK